MGTGLTDEPRRLAALWLGALALGLLVLVPATDASAAKKVKTSTGDLFVDADSVNGTISSKRAECRQGRKVKLRSGSDGKVIASDKTDKQGRWAVTVQLGVGVYYAEVTKASKNSKQGKVTCQGAKSKSVTI